MTAPLPLLTEEEVRRISGDGEGGYGCLRTDRGVLPLVEMNVDAKVIATFAHTTVRQVFQNNLGQPLEATYIFPLPDRAAVTRFTMTVAGRSVEGVLEERMQARRTYDRAIAEGKRASIAEEERAGVFTMRVGNLMPGETATVTLEMSGALPVADGEVTYRFPLVVAPRYMPGQALGGGNVGDGTANDTDAVPDASRISPPVLLPGLQSPVRLSMSVDLDAAGLPLNNVRSSLHAAYADDRASATVGRLVVRTSAGERVNRDFILRFTLGDAAIRTSARVCDGTFSLTLLPPSIITSTTARAKDVVFVLDRSGSMEGWKMVAARRATARMIDALRPGDKFQVLAFDNVVEPLPLGNDLVDATDRNRFQATEWLGKVGARGGTEMAAPLARAADLLSGGYLERDRVLVFVTDGQVGNESQLMALLGQRLRGARVFALGIDQAVNAAFLNRLAQLGRSGDAELVESEDRLDEVLVRVHRRVDAPVVAELSVDVQGASLVPGTLTPAQLPDVFTGVPACIFGKVQGGGGFPTFVVRGRLSDGSRFEERVHADAVMNPAIRTAWARLHLRDLEDRFDAGHGDKAELERRIVQVSLDHKVLCRFTAFVAVDGEVVNRGGWLKQAVQPVEAPAGWNMPAGAAAMPGQARAKMGFAASGAAAPPPPAAPAPRSPPADLFKMKEVADDLMLDSEAADVPTAAPRKRELRQEEKAKARADEGGFFGSVKDALGGMLGPKGGKQAPSSKLDPFRTRIHELVELARKKGSDLFGIARELEQRMRLLVEDLAHAGFAANERRALEESMRAVKDAVSSGDSLAVERAVDQAENALVALGGPPAAATSTAKAREGFWR
jgi:Ca-activated chloride channel family protein